MSARTNLAPTPTQLRVVEAYARLGSQQLVADEIGISVQTVKNHLRDLYVRLGVEGGAVNALRKLGYIRLPGDTGVSPCGWLATCGRPEGHRGQHGGFRPLLRGTP